MSEPTTYVWSALREQFCRRVNDTPSARQEARVLDVFQTNPALVADAIGHVAARFDAGAIRAAWPVLVTHVEQARDNARRGSRPVTDEGERTRHVDRVRQWLRAAGMHFDSESEVEHQLFDDGGALRPFAGDVELRNELLAEWRRLRPRGVDVEIAAEDRAAAWIASRPKVRAAAGGVEGRVPEDPGSGELDLVPLLRDGGAAAVEAVIGHVEDGATGQEVGLTAAARNPFTDDA